jgi:hypothetical protein
MGEAVLRQRTVAGGPGHLDLMPQALELMGKVEDVAGYSTGVSEVIRANEKDSQEGRVTFG